MAVVEAIQAGLQGGAPISPAVAAHLLTRVRREAAGGDAARRADAGLTERELAILNQLAKGLSLKEVARVEGISPYTVGDHVKAIYRKLSVNSRGEAVFEAMQAGLIHMRDR